MVLLTARVSDLGSPERLAASLWADEVVGHTDEESWEMTANRLVGMLNIAARLLVRLEEATALPTEELLRELSEWIEWIEQQG